MALNLTIREVSDEKELGGLRNFLLGQALWYSNYERWVEEVCIPDIENNWKTAIVAYSNNYVVGDAIFQKHKQLPRTREIKNLRINPEYRRKDLAHFLIRHVEEENKELFDRIILDTDTKNTGIVRFLIFCGYRPIMQLPLYSDNNLDVIFSKEFPVSYLHNGTSRNIE